MGPAEVDELLSYVVIAGVLIASIIFVVAALTTWLSKRSNEHGE